MAFGLVLFEDLPYAVEEIRVDLFQFFRDILMYRALTD